MKLNGFILCEDIRREYAGSVTLVGVCDALTIHTGMATGTESIPVRLGIYIKLSLDDSGESMPDLFRLHILDRERPLHTVQGSLDQISDHHSVNLAFVLQQVRVPIHAEEISFRLVLLTDGEETVTLTPDSIPIKLRTSR